MDVEADVVAQVVREEGLDGLVGGHVEAELREAVLEAVLGDLVQRVERDGGGRAAERDASALGREDGAV